MGYYPGMMEEQTMYEDMMQYEEEMTIGQKDWDVLLLTICHREVALENILKQSNWTERQVERWNDELNQLMRTKKKVLDKIR
jgi:hypothetical protein